MTSLPELFADLAVAPRLPGASCRGHVDLFDRTAGKAQAADTREARSAALTICHACPTLHGCRTWLDGLPPDQRPIGVVAGQIVTEDKTTSGFQRERAERDAHIVKLHAAGLTNHEIVAATGHSKSTVRRALITPKGPQPMTNHEAADHRRATALVCHYGRNNLDGVNAILAEASETNRVVALIGATLSLHAHVVPILYTPDGLACLTHMIYRLAEEPDIDEDCARACRLVVAHSQQDLTATKAVLADADNADRASELIMAILTLFSSTVPILYSELGLHVLERSILNWAIREGQGDAEGGSQ